MSFFHRLGELYRHRHISPKSSDLRGTHYLDSLDTVIRIYGQFVGDKKGPSVSGAQLA